MIEGVIEGCNMEGASLRNAGLGDSTIGDTNLRNANLEGCSGEISMINVELTGAFGFRPSIVFAGYRKLTLPDGRFIADWQTEEIYCW
jgi:uncharacterized protein YjbI with pentapeptide repeats